MVGRYVGMVWLTLIHLFYWHVCDSSFAGEFPGRSGDISASDGGRAQRFAPPVKVPDSEFDACAAQKPKEWAEKLTLLRTRWSVVSTQCQMYGVASQPYENMYRDENNAAFRSSGRSTSYFEFTKRNQKIIIDSQIFLGNIKTNQIWNQNYQQMFTQYQNINGKMGANDEFTRKVNSFDEYHTNLTYDEFSLVRNQGYANYCRTRVPEFNAAMAWRPDQLVAFISQNVCGTQQLVIPSVQTLARARPAARTRRAVPKSPTGTSTAAPLNPFVRNGIGDGAASLASGGSTIAKGDDSKAVAARSAAQSTDQSTTGGSATPTTPAQRPLEAATVARLPDQPNRRTYYRCNSNANRARNIYYQTAMMEIYAEKCRSRTMPSYAAILQRYRTRFKSHYDYNESWLTALEEELKLLPTPTSLPDYQRTVLDEERARFSLKVPLSLEGKVREAAIEKYCQDFRDEFQKGRNLTVNPDSSIDSFICATP